MGILIPRRDFWNQIPTVFGTRGSPGYSLNEKARVLPGRLLEPFFRIKEWEISLTITPGTSADGLSRGFTTRVPCGAEREVSYLNGSLISDVTVPEEITNQDVWNAYGMGRIDSGYYYWVTDLLAKHETNNSEIRCGYEFRIRMNHSDVWRQYIEDEEGPDKYRHNFIFTFSGYIYFWYYCYTTTGAFAGSGYSRIYLADNPVSDEDPVVGKWCGLDFQGTPADNYVIPPTRGVDARYPDGLPITVSDFTIQPSEYWEPFAWRTGEYTP